MGLFRKKVKSETKENTNIDGIEIVDLESSNDKVVNTLEQRKEFKIAIFRGLISWVMALSSFITKIFSSLSTLNAGKSLGIFIGIFSPPFPLLNHIFAIFWIFIINK